MVLKRRRSYLQGAQLPCQATTSSGECPIGARHRWPWNLAISSKSPSVSSYAAFGVRKSRGLERPLEPIGPRYGSRRRQTTFSHQSPGDGPPKNGSDEVGEKRVWLGEISVVAD